ncbi:TPA: hypothetical protein QDB51_002925 [Burkholderia vietnamiensis]|nr:hypothetical protein [Burkholderia vietnamiensis]
MNRIIEVVGDPSYGTNQLLPGLPAVSNWNCNILLALTQIGLLTAPPRYHGFHLSTFWAWLRYVPAIDSRKADLRLRRAWSEMDPHQKTILADDFGVGFSCQYLIDNHQLQFFADTRYVLDRCLGTLVSPVTVNQGKFKSPDFIGVDAFGHLHVIECKGSQSSRGYLKTAMESGIDQKNNLSGNIFRSCMVGGFFVPQFNNKEVAQLRFIDPAPDPRMRMLADVEPGAIVRAIRILAFAKFLSAAGLWRSASVLTEGRAVSTDVNFVRDLRTGELRFAGYERQLDSGDWVKEIDYRSFEEQGSDSVDAQAIKTSLKIRIPDYIADLAHSAVTPDGTVNLNTLDAELASREKLNRHTVELPREIVEEGIRMDLDQTTRAPETSWHRDELGENSASITTPFGIELSLSRAQF